MAGPSTALGQIDHLIELGERPNISIRVISFDYGPYPGLLGSFTLLEFPNPEDDDVLYLEHVDGDKVIREEPEVTAEYTQRFFDLEKIALSEADTRSLLEDIRRGLGGGSPKPGPQKVEAST